MPASPRFRLDFSGRDAVDRSAGAEKQLRALPAADHSERARLLAILAAARLIADPGTAGEAATGAQREAAMAGDDVSQAWALLAACAVDLSPDALTERVAAAREILRVARERGVPELASTGFFLLLGGLTEQGSIPQLDEELNPTGLTISAFPWLETGRHVAWFRCMRATLDGQADLAEQLANAAYQTALAEGDQDAEIVWVGQVAIVRWMQGRVSELEPAFLKGRQNYPGEPVWAVSLAWIWLRQGRASAARGLIASLPPIDSFPRDRNWLATVSILAVVVAELGEKNIAMIARDALLPFQDRLATIGLGVTCWGTIARPLALIERMLGNEAAAIAHYRTAVEVSARIGAQAWLAEIQWELAALLAKNSGGAELDEAIALASEAAATGRILQLHGVEDSAAAVLAELEARRTVVPDIRPVVEAMAPSIRVLGSFEVVSVDGEVARWQSRKARELLKILVARRGAAIERETVMDLLWPGLAPQQVANRFAVAATTVRRALDPHGRHPSNAYLETQGNLVRLRIENMDVDVECFLADVQAALSDLIFAHLRSERLTTALELYRGDALAEEPHAQWAERLNREVQSAYFAASHTLAETAEQRGDHLTRADVYRRILAVDRYDQRAYEGLIDSLSQLGAHGQVGAAREEYTLRMAELGIAVAS